MPLPPLSADDGARLYVEAARRTGVRMVFASANAEKISRHCVNMTVSIAQVVRREATTIPSK